MGTLDVWYDHLDLEKTVSDTSDLFSQELKTLMNNAMKKQLPETAAGASFKESGQYRRLVKRLLYPPAVGCRSLSCLQGRQFLPAGKYGRTE